MIVLVVIVGLLLAFANGANDNFKGVATLFGSGTTDYRRALLWGTAATGLGSLAALFLARELLQSFSGKGLVPPEALRDPSFPAAVALAAALTVLLATRLGFPVSTTHALLGAMVGAGLLASPTGVNGSQLATRFMLPLLTSPFIAVIGAALLYPVLRSLRRRVGLTRDSCLCVSEQIVDAIPVGLSTAPSLVAIRRKTITAGTTATCRVHGNGEAPGLRARPTLDTLHYISAGAVSFARGVNDTPKLAALLLVGGLLNPSTALVLVGVVVGVGGLTAARRVAETMSRKVTAMNAGQGFTANVVTAGLVIGASALGLPVSTTHVSCGSLFGIGAATRQARWRAIGAILLAWVITLPLAGLLGAAFLVLLR